MESPLLPGVIFIALQLFQELRHADSSPSSAKRPIKAPREVFLRKLIEHVLLKIKKNKKKQHNTHHFALQANSIKHRKPRGQDARDRISCKYYLGNQKKLMTNFPCCVERTSRPALSLCLTSCQRGVWGGRSMPGKGVRWQFYAHFSV